MNKVASKGFTLVELLIVIVVIAILAAVTIVAYNGAQGRARDSARYSDVKNILDALELYHSQNGVFPANSPTMSTNPGGCAIGGSYSYSYASDGTWIKPLVSGKYIDSAPIPPVNDCSHYYRYYHSTSSTENGCTYGVGFYVLQVQGAEGTIIPSQALPLGSAGPSGCTSWPAALTTTKTTWTFVGYDDGLSHP